MKLTLKHWINISLFNLLLVALLGVVMRYKIGFEFPFLKQKYLMHAHSHFAFAGWISHALLVLLIAFIQRNASRFSETKYSVAIIANLICAYGMLGAFIYQGYGAVSITFSTASLLVTYFFAFVFFKDLKQVAANHPGKNWFKAALWFNIFSSLGTYALAYMMATKHVPRDFYLSSVYYYLHFQYNGWFFFACMGLFISRMHEFKIAFQHGRKVFWMFFLSCIPAYFLSLLWFKMPAWLYFVIVMSAVVQVIAWVLFYTTISKNIQVIRSKISAIARYLFLFAALALSVKFLLQLVSPVPGISKIAFGFRPIVIAYLHLALLAVITVFILGYFFAFNFIKTNRLSIAAIIIFTSGIFLTELLLMTQGLAALNYNLIPYANEMLFAFAIVLLSGIFLLLVSQRFIKAA